jgi:hypothetical protein
MGDRNTIVVIALSVFVVLTAVFGGVAFYYNLEGEDLTGQLERERNLAKEHQVRVDGPDGLKKAIAQVETQTKAQRDEAQQVRDTLCKDTRTVIDTNLADGKKAHEEREKVEAARSAAAVEDTNKVSRAYEDLRKTLSTLEDELKKNRGELDKEQATLLESKSGEVGRQDKLREELARLAAEIGVLEAKLKRMQEVRAQLMELKEDGRIVGADASTNLAVVGLGSRQGVHPGMVFEVFEVKKDGKKVVKAKVRLQKVENQQSMAVILAAQSVPKACPTCGWSTTDKAMLYCPYCRGGEDNKDAQRLQDLGREFEVVEPDFLNPVGKGDCVSSPFYFGGKNRRAFRFAVAGQPTGHSRQEMTAYLKENGCTLVDEITVDTDFVVVGSGPKVDEDLKRARQMGASLIRESDLFDFFGRAGVSSDAPPAETAAK